MVLEKLFRDRKLLRVGSHPGQSGLHGFLHYLADLSGHGEAALALHLVGLNEEDVAASRCPSQAHSHAGALGALRNSCTICGVTTSLSGLPSAIRRACLRHMVPMLRSRLRTPASRV